MNYPLEFIPQRRFPHCDMTPENPEETDEDALRDAGNLGKMEQRTDDTVNVYSHAGLEENEGKRILWS